MNNKRKEGKMSPQKESYSLVGFVKGISIKSSKANEIMIEAAPSFIIEDGEVKRILFVPSAKNKKLDEAVAVLCEFDEQKSYSCIVDASVLLQLKLNHTKVRFEFDSKRKQIVSIIVL